MENIKILFDDLYEKQFPSHGSKDIDGISLILVDSDTMGLASSFLHSKGNLTEQEIDMLDSCIKELEIIIPKLNAIEKDYFGSLKILAKEIFKIAHKY